MKLQLFVGTFLSIGIASVALAHNDKDDNYCNKVQGDSIVGQYIGSHPDGTTPTHLIINEGGTAVYSDINFIGSGAPWTGVPDVPYGRVTTGGDITWKKVGKNKYNVVLTTIAGTSTPIGDPGSATNGQFPAVGFYRIYGPGTMSFKNENSCKELDIDLKLCTFEITDLVLQSPGVCANVQLKMFKVKGP